jgi:hypothetical protein
MARREVDIGVEGNDGTGDSIRESFRKVNNNFTELYAVFGQGGNISFLNLDDTPTDYAGNENRVVFSKGDGLGVEFFELVSDAGTNDATDPNNTVAFSFDDDARQIKIRAINTRLSQDSKPVLTSELAAGAVIGYTTAINNSLVNNTADLVAQYNATHGTSSGVITEDNLVISKGYADSNYVNVTGDAMTGNLGITGALTVSNTPNTGTQVPQTQEVITRAGSVANRTMDDALFLHDHPGALSGAGTPTGPEDLQAATKYYVDNTSFASSTNLFVSTQGDDSQAKTPAGKEGRALSYAYRTIAAACEAAEGIIRGTPFEPGPYVQTMSYLSGGNSIPGKVTGTPAVSNAGADALATAALLATLRDDVAESTTNYITTTYPGFTYNVDLCARDVGLIIDSVRLDILGDLQQNYLSRWAGLRYYANPSANIARVNQNTETVAGIEYAKTTLISAAITEGIPANYRTAIESRFDDVISFLDPNTAEVALSETGDYYALQITNGNIGLEQGNTANRDIRAGKIVKGKQSGAVAEIIDYTFANGATDDFSLKLLEPIEFIVGEELEFGNKTQNNQISIRVESGIYDEHMPIRIPENVSIKGDEFRRTVIRPKRGQSQSKWANTYFYRSGSVDGITTATGGLAFTHPNPATTETGFYGRHYITDPSAVQNIGTDGAANPGAFKNAGDLLYKNKSYAIEETIQYITAQVAIGTGIWAGFTYDESKCRRDLGFIIDGIILDLDNGGREATLVNQGFYASGAAVTGQEAQTKAAIQQLKVLFEYIWDNGAGGVSYTTLGSISVTTDVDLPPEAASNTNADALVDCVAFGLDNSAYNPAKDNNKMDVFLCNDNTIVRNVTCQKHGGFMMVLDPTGQILTRSPYAQTCSSFSQSQGTDKVFAGGMYIDGYAGNMPATITGLNNSNVFRLSVSSPADHGLFIRKPQTPFPFYVGGIRYQVNAIENYNQSAGTAVLILDEDSNAPDPVENSIQSINLTGTNVVLEFSSAHGLNNAQQIIITNVNGTTELNSNTYYVGNTVATSFTVYRDSALTDPVLVSEVSAYVSGGDVRTVVAGTGWSGSLPADIFMQSGGNRSMLANDYTQLNDNGYGVIATNNALSELVSVFTYYCHTGYIAANGSQIRSLTGNNSYGIYGLVSEGADPDEIPQDATLNQDMVFPCKTFQAQYQVRFTGDVSSNVSVGDFIYQDNTTAVAEVSFISNSGRDVHVLSTVNGIWNTTATNGIRFGATAVAAATGTYVDGTASAGAANTPAFVKLMDAFSEAGDLVVYAYDLSGDPLNVSEIEIYHRADDVYQPYEVTNSTDPNLYISSYQAEASGGEVNYTTAASGTSASFRIGKTTSSGYNVTVTAGGSGYSVSDTFTVVGADLGGATPANNVTITVSEVDSGTITGATITGTAVTDSNTAVIDNKIWKFNLGTGIEGTAENGLQYETAHDTPIVFRHKQNFVMDGVVSVPTRPSTALVFAGDPNGSVTYRTIGFGRTITAGKVVAANQSVITFDSNYDYLDLNLDQDALALADNDANISPAIPGAAGAKTLGASAGDTQIAINRISTVDEARLDTQDMIFTWGGKAFKITGYSEHTNTSTGNQFAVIEFTDHATNIVNGASGTGLNTFPGGTGSELVSARGITLKAGLETGEPVEITVNISTCRATSHDMLDIGTGGYNATNYPERILGQPVSEPVTSSDAIDSTGNKSKAQVQERDKGRVFAVLTDQDGFFRVGRFFEVDQGTGAITFNAALVLTNIDGIGFKRGVRVNEFSSDDTFTDAKGDAVPTQTAVEGYINSRLGRDREGQLVPSSDVIPSGGGFIYKAGDTMVGTLNMDNNRITNLQPNTSVADDAATIGYVNDKTDELNDIGDVTITGNTSAIQSDILVFTGQGASGAQLSQNATVTGDIGFTYDPSNLNEIDTLIQAGTVDDGKVFTPTAFGEGITQAKLFMNRAGTFDEDDVTNGIGGTAPQVGQSFVGLAAFSDNNFEVESDDIGGGTNVSTGRVRIKEGGVANAELANSSITIAASGGTSTAVALGSTMTFAGTTNEISVSESSGTLTISLPGTINANTTGNAASADTIDTVQRSTNATHYMTFVDSDNSTATAENLYTDAGVSYNPSTNILTVSSTIDTPTINMAPEGVPVITMTDSTTSTYSQGKYGRLIWNRQGPISGINRMSEISSALEIDDTFNWGSRLLFEAISQGQFNNHSIDMDTGDNLQINSGHGLRISLSTNARAQTASDALAMFPGTNNTYNLGKSGARWNTVYATVFDGTATEALYADLAENYLGDESYEPGTVLVFGGDAELTITTTKGDHRVAGIVTTNPAHLMNSALEGDHVVGLALQGRVPCKVIGKVAPGDMLVTSSIPGFAVVNNTPGVGQVIGKAVGSKDDTERGIVEVVVGRV